MIVKGILEVVLTKKDREEVELIIKKVRSVKVPDDSYFDGFHTLEDRKLKHKNKKARLNKSKGKE
jgi:hypothetical protein